LINSPALQTKKDNNDGSGSGNINDLINSPALQTKKDNNDGSGSGNTGDLINFPALRTRKDGDSGTSNNDSDTPNLSRPSLRSLLYSTDTTQWRLAVCEELEKLQREIDLLKSNK